MVPEESISSSPSPTSSPAGAGKRPLWGQLPPGPYAVGYQSSFHRDYARRYDLLFPESGSAAAPPQPRPILISVWYPARESPPAEPMRQGEYLQLVSEDAALAKFAERLAAACREATCEGVMGKLPGQLRAAEPAIYEQFCRMTTAAHRNAAAAEGAFPLVLYHPGFGGPSVGDTVLFEFLASHGYVVVTSAYQPKEAAELRVGADLDLSMKDLAYLLHHMQDRPQVDMERIGAMGCSYGAQAVLAWAAEVQPAIRAVVSLDTTLEYCPLDQEEVHVEGGIRVNMSLRDVRRRFEQAKQFSMPLLIFAQARLDPDFILYEKLPHAERYYAQVRFIHHLHFDSLVAFTRDLLPEADPGSGVGNPQQIRAAYEAVCRLTLRFLDAYLKADAQALESLRSEPGAPERNAPADRDRAMGAVTWQYRRPAPFPLSEALDS